ncbi:MAG: GIY-YIG nuclease family protein [Armatimonadota bacterium]|nr:MAG: GIY-YIG nuclease family protein [Armatimonadota bacterium]
MKRVYLLESVRYPRQRYVGLASDPEERLKEHNAGKSPHTSRYVPWRIVAAVRFEKAGRAVAFERYLKSGPGRAFAKRHFW